MSMTEELKRRKATRAQGFGPKAAQTAQSSHTPQATPPIDPDTAEAKHYALQFAGAAQANIATQLQQKTGFLQGLDEMLDKAATAIATAEQDILSGVALERKLAEQRSEYAYGAIEAATVAIEFEALTTLEDIAKPQSFPSVSDTLKRITPAQKARLDQAVLGPAD